MNRDGPGHSADNELTVNRTPVCNGDIPTSIEARVIATQEDFSSTGQTVEIDPEDGFICYNDQNDPNCENYEVRHCCPP